MANPRLIKKRVKSISNIGKITKALEMVAASRVQKAQEKAVKAKPYAVMISKLVASLADQSVVKDIPLMRQPTHVDSDLYIVITSNRGLAGSLNTNLLRKLNQKLVGNSCKHSFVTLGKKGRSLAMQNGTLIADLSEYKDVASKMTDSVKIAIDNFTTGACDEVYVVYSNFLTALTQEAEVKRILPISRDELARIVTMEMVDRNQITKESEVVSTTMSYEPDPITVLTDLLPYYLEIQIAESLYEAEASEHSARMIAMKNASDNAGELTQGLTLEYNKARQSMITTEISDITTAQESLK